MSTKNELQLMLKTFGYDLNSNTSKDTLVNLLHLHSKALKQGIDVPKMNDHELRCYLNKYHILIGPVIGHTRIIYQRQLLEAINKEIDESVEDTISDNNEKFGTLSINLEDGIVTRSGRIIFHDHQSSRFVYLKLYIE